MKTVLWTKYGSPDGLIPGEKEIPEPGDRDILIKIAAASVSAGDCEFRRLELPLGLSFPMRLYAGWRKPERLQVLGQEFAGEVVATGKDVSNYKPGDPVFGTTGMGFGAYSEYIRLPSEPGDAQGILSIKPDNLTFEEAAVLPTAGMEAIHYLRKASLAEGQNVLIIGAGGSIGTLVLQLAKSRGASVTAVDSPDKLKMLRQLGADLVIDYNLEDYTQRDERFDLIIDVVGRKSVLKKMRLLKKQGNYFLAYAGIKDLFLSLFFKLFTGKRLRIESAGQSREEMDELTELAAGGVLKPQIDRVFPLDKAAEAHRYAESGSKKGNIVLKVAD